MRGDVERVGGVGRIGGHVGDELRVRVLPIFEFRFERLQFVHRLFFSIMTANARDASGRVVAIAAAAICFGGLRRAECAL